MSSIDIKLTKPVGIFIIIERLYARDGLAPSIGELGPSLTQIHRTVIQLRRKQDMYMDGAKLSPSDISLWQRIKYLTGTVVTTKDTNEFVYTPEFMGSLLAATPLANVEYKNIPRFLTTEGIYSLPKVMAFGRDPIPDVLLYGKSNTTFFIDDGGRGTPTAIAKYHQRTKDLMMINSQSDVASIMKDLIVKGVKL
ncbi:hypothetical protein RBA63_08225 [Brenneria goodwinii]|uniref:hypothetical protein n=1 Tax=Brenneria goodwinii TaxID=1109412 RepID=UPI0036E6FA73